jgi:hypothetical protein
MFQKYNKKTWEDGEMECGIEEVSGSGKGKQI